MNEVELTTVVVTTYNNSDTIEPNISSILNQTLPIDQLIIVDDNSKDNTIEKIKTIFHKEIDIGTINIFINKKNYGGPAHGRNIGISKAIGKYIYFCDGDDIWDKRMTSSYSEIFKKNEFDIISSDRYFFRKGEEINFKDHGNLKRCKVHDFDFLSNPICTSSVAGFTSVFKRFMFNEQNYMRGIEDYDCFLRMKAKKVKFCKLKNKFLFYRKTENSLSSNKLQILKKLFLMFKNNYEEKNFYPKFSIVFLALLRVNLFVLHKLLKEFLKI